MMIRRKRNIKKKRILMILKDKYLIDIFVIKLVILITYNQLFNLFIFLNITL